MPQDRPHSPSREAPERERENVAILVRVPKDRASYAAQAIEALLSFADVPHAVRALGADDPLSSTAEPIRSPRHEDDPPGGYERVFPAQAAPSRRKAKTAFLEVAHPNLGPGDALRELRRGQGLSQAELARRAGLRDRRDGADLERGERSLDAETAGRLGAALGADLAFFLR